MACGKFHLKSCSSDLTVYPDVKVMIPNESGSPSSALEKRLYLIMAKELEGHVGAPQVPAVERGG